MDQGNFGNDSGDSCAVHCQITNGVNSDSTLAPPVTHMRATMPSRYYKIRATCLFVYLCVNSFRNNLATAVRDLSTGTHNQDQFSVNNWACVFC